MKRFLWLALIACLFAAPNGRAAEFLKDTFTGANGDNITAHTGESGVTWTGNGINGDYTEIYGGQIVSNRLAGAWVGFQWGNNMRAVVTPPSAEYIITAVVRVTSVDGMLTIFGRYVDGTGYLLVLRPGGMDFKYHAPSGYQDLGAGDSSFTWVPGHDYTIRWELKNAVKNVYVDGVLKLSETSINWSPEAGSIAIAIGGGDATTGFQIDSITASTVDNPSAPAISSPTAVSGVVGEAFSYLIQATNSPISYGVSGTLPAGLNFGLSTLNDTATARISYSGAGWGYSANRQAYANYPQTDLAQDVHYTVNNEDFATFTFTGTSIKWLSETQADEGTVDVYIDGQFDRPVDCYTAPRLCRQVVYSRNDLSPGTHTIKVVKKSGDYMVVDGFVFGTPNEIGGTPTTVGSSVVTISAINSSNEAVTASLTITINAAPSTSDSQAPSVPNGLAASALTESSFTLSWNVSSDNVGVTGYEVKQDSGAPIFTIGTSLGFSNLTQGMTYVMRARARDAVGNWSEWSDPLPVNTNDTQPPAVPGGLGHTAVTTTSFTLTWTASNDNVGVAIYQVLKDGTYYDTTSGTSMNVTGLSPGTTYAMTVKALDAAGNTSAPSAPHGVTTGSLSQPTLLILHGQNQTSPAGQFNPIPFEIAVVNAAGPQPMPGVSVTFTVQSGGGLLALTNTGTPALNSVLAPVSDEDGTVRVYYQQPSTVGVSSHIRVTAGLAAPLTLLSISGGLPGDADADGLPDIWELRYFGLLGGNPTDDSDGDGMLNIDEYHAGRNPKERLDAFALPAGCQLVLPTPAATFFGIKTSDWSITPVFSP